MALTADKLIHDDRFYGDNVFQFILYFPFGLLLIVLRTVLALVLWIAAIILPNKSAVRQMLSTLACWTFGVYVKLKGTRDPRCSVMVANYVSCLDSLAVSHVLGTISLRKWKVPPFFASTLGIKNAAQFVRKQHFADSPSKPVLLQPEGGPTNGKGLLKFNDWPFPIGNRVQPVAITVERMFTRVCVHGDSESRNQFPWRDALWFLFAPLTAYRVKALPALERHDDDDATFVDRIRSAIAEALQVEATELKYEDLSRRPLSVRREVHPELARGVHPELAREVHPELARRAAQVKEVLPRVPMRDIIRDLASTRSVDVTITNFLEGVTSYRPEPIADTLPQPGTSSEPTQPKYITPVPTGVFPKSAKERQMSFQERKTQMIEEARNRYIEKHGLNVALNNC